MRRGRPSPYNAKRSDEIISIMRQGYSLTAAAGSMGIHRATLYRWGESHPEFCDALSLAKGLRVLKWEQELLSTTDKSRVRICIATLKNADPEEWNKAWHPRHSSA
jgi:hypothetical protein